MSPDSRPRTNTGPVVNFTFLQVTSHLIMASRITLKLTGLARAAGPSRRCLSTASQPVRVARGRYLAGLVVVAGTAMVVGQQSEDVWKRLSESFVAHADATVLPERLPFSKPGGMRLDPSTEIVFPLHLDPATPGPLLRLVGLGVRTVSFLRVKVYSVGFYLEEAQTRYLKEIPGWDKFAVEQFLAPESSGEGAGPSGETLVRNLLDRPVSCAVRIVPVRNTDFGHLRDGFTRAIAARQKIARSAGQLTDADEERIAQSTQTLKALFPAQSVPKGKALTLLRRPDGALTIEYEGKILGQVNDSWVSRELMLAYFADKDAISPKLKEDVAEGFQGFIGF
ncbi:chalcone-flavanone isomerase-domain-containing protein [Papiliotrema laurentii]|uniref:Chalcone-flavanone isomerase-domain-containing protein n=1 Tax=Papiliotrema laurentii TaxID=5418 RepID=A0AAD9D0D4_PAPLA|nr:chalcone-flavanone isomerase-domain-containing protein [Papiliotrema laurentii]